MSNLPEVLTRGERARLFPVLAETSKEGRTLSIFLACMENVQEFGRSLLNGIGQRTGARTRIEAYTEVVLKKGGEKAHRPDGLIVVRSGSKSWMALVEAKVANSELTTEQLEAYLDLAKMNGIDAVITLSNQFAPLPTHHPVSLSYASRRKSDLFHWSWMYAMTQASLLVSNDEVADRDQWMLLNEFVRFLSHPSAGVRGFDQMPAAWSEIVNAVQAGGRVSSNSSEAREIVGAWHQEVRDLSLILSRQLGTVVETRLPRAHATDPTVRMKAATTELAQGHQLATTLIVPDAAAPMDICADLTKRSVSVSMKLKAPADRKSTKARVNWLLRQLQDAKGTNIHVRMFWPGRTAHTQCPLLSLRDDPDTAIADRNGQVVLSFEVLLVKDLGAKFAQRRNFIGEIEAAVPEFYEQIGQHLREWQAPAPRIRDSRVEPNSVDPDAIQRDAEHLAQERQDAPHADGP